MEEKKVKKTYGIKRGGNLKKDSIKMGERKGNIPCSGKIKI